MNKALFNIILPYAALISSISAILFRLFDIYEVFLFGIPIALFLGLHLRHIISLEKRIKELESEKT